jgi:hypothetical protein
VTRVAWRSVLRPPEKLRAAWAGWGNLGGPFAGHLWPGAYTRTFTFLKVVRTIHGVPDPTSTSEPVLLELADGRLRVVALNLIQRIAVR